MLQKLKNQSLFWKNSKKGKAKTGLCSGLRPQFFALPNQILSQRVTVKRDIDYLVEDSVIFKGDSHMTLCDALFLATDYKNCFLSESIVPVHENQIWLSKSWLYFTGVNFILNCANFSLHFVNNFAVLFLFFKLAKYTTLL